MTDREFPGCDSPQSLCHNQSIAYRTYRMPQPFPAVDRRFIENPAGFRVVLVADIAHGAFAVLPGMRRGSRYDQIRVYSFICSAVGALANGRIVTVIPRVAA